MATTYGVTGQGFILKRLNDIRNDMATALSTIQDPVSGEYLTPDLNDENDPLVQIVNSLSDQLSACWEQLQLCYNQFDPLKATGHGLSGLVQLNGIRRKAGTYSTVVVNITGSANLALPAGLKFGSMDGTAVFVLPAVTLDSSGSATGVIATASTIGPVAALAGTLTNIITPYPGFNTITNPSDATPGTAEENDIQLRGRQQNSTMTTSSSLVESVYSALLNLNGVTYARVYQNITSATDSRGIPAKSIAAVVSGGSNADIAQVLWLKASAFPQYGTTTVPVEDSQGFSYDMSFIRPTEVPVYVAVAVTVVNASMWPADGADRIKAAILAYATGGSTALGVTPDWGKDGWTIGENVYASELYVPVNSVPGAQITSILLDTVSPPAATSVAIAWNEVSQFLSANITVTVS